MSLDPKSNLVEEMTMSKVNSGQKTVLQVVPALEIGGAERGTIDVATALVAAGWRALVVSQGGRMVADLEDAGAQHITLPMASKNPLQMAINTRSLRHIIERENVNIIHARSRAPAWSAYFAAGQADITFITTYQSIYSETFPLKRLYNSVMARGQVTIANSDYTAAIIQERHSDVAEKIEVIYRGVDLEVFSAQNITRTQRQQIFNDWQLDSTVKVLLLSARLTRRKGHGLLLEALARLDLATLPPFVCVFAGDTKDREHVVDRLVQQSLRLGLPQDMIRFVGHCEDMAAGYLAADVVLMPSTVPEAFGRVAAEAQAMGKPVIVTDIGAVGETVRAQPEFGVSEITGWRITPDNPDSLAEAIVQALRMPEADIERIRQNAITFITQNYSVGKMTSATLEIYDRLSEIH